MSYRKALRKMFHGVDLKVEDLLLLEAFQIGYLKDRVPAREFVAVLLEYPEIKYFMINKCPTAKDFIDRVIDKFGPADSKKELRKCCDTLVWELADLLIYNKHPDIYDSRVILGWNFDDIRSVTSITDKVVIDAGAGSGRVAFKAVQDASMVFAVEPCASLRNFIVEKGKKKNISNLFVVDGFLHAIPLPKGFADVLITSNSIGWNLDDELKEIERVVKPGGYAIHLTSSTETDDPFTKQLTKPRWHYSYFECKKNEFIIRKYWTQMV
jgi:SAM-dependent methyltransferase